jgi:hypothetical protein
MFQAIQLALRDYHKARIHRALKLFRRSAFTLLCSRLGRMVFHERFYDPIFGIDPRVEW